MPRRQLHQKEPLYRKVNTRTHGVRHGCGAKAKWERNTKAGKADDTRHGSMHSGQRHGRDYTPLFRFLISRVGQPWDTVHSEVLSRLDDPAPIFWLVALHPQDAQDVVRLGESSYFSGLWVDETGCLARVNPDLTLDDMVPPCSCCTHTFNGQRFTQSCPLD